MAASVFDSALYGKLFSSGDAARLFSDTAEVRAMLLVEGALAKVQGALGVILEAVARSYLGDDLCDQSRRRQRRRPTTKVKRLEWSIAACHCWRRANLPEQK